PPGGRLWRLGHHLERERWQRFRLRRLPGVVSKVPEPGLLLSNHEQHHADARGHQPERRGQFQRFTVALRIHPLLRRLLERTGVLGWAAPSWERERSIALRSGQLGR